jgi:peptidoglycan hydrolase CwlO-like protein
MLPGMRRRVGGVFALACLLISLTAAVAHAQQDLVESDPDVIRARSAVVAAQQAAHEAAAAVEKTNQQRDATQASIDDHVTRIADLDQQRADLAAQRDALLDVLRQRAAALYRAGGDPTSLRVLAADNAVEAARRQQLGDAAAKTTQRTTRKLEETREELGKVQDTLRSEESDLRSQKAQLDDLVRRQEQQQSVMDAKVAAANAALATARAIGAVRASHYAVMGPSTLTADQIVAWYNAQGYHPRIETTVSDLVQTFLQEASDENVRGDLAFAQTIVETAGLNAAPANNYSGIGWCDSCSTGNRFPTPREGVRAQIQLLVNYADAGSRAANLHHPVSQYLYSGDPATQARKFDTFFAKGWAPTWEDMGNGNWATATHYSSAVIGVYNRMLSYIGRAG